MGALRATGLRRRSPDVLLRFRQPRIEPPSVAAECGSNSLQVELVGSYTNPAEVLISAPLWG